MDSNGSCFLRENRQFAHQIIFLTGHVISIHEYVLRSASRSGDPLAGTRKSLPWLSAPKPFSDLLF